MAKFDPETRTLLFDSTDRMGHIREVLEIIPDVPQVLLSASGDERKLLMLDYSYDCLCQALPFVHDLTKALRDSARAGGIREYRSFIDGVITTSDPCTIVYQAARFKAQQTHMMVQAFKDYPLSLEEVFELESVRSQRSKINREWSDFIQSSSWNTISVAERKSRESAYLAKLDGASTLVWKILHLGADRLTPDVRLAVKASGGDYRKSIDSRLSQLRISELNKYHQNPSNYVLPAKLS